MATTVQMKVSAEDLSQLPKGGGERIPNPGIMVIFGASGDLTKRKLLPALFHLEQAGLLPKEFAIVGVARRTLGDEFAADMRSGIVEFGGVKDSDPKLEEFSKKISYYALSFDDASHYAGLKEELDRIAKEKGIGPDRLFYLATAPEYFAPIIENLGAQGMAQPEQGRVGVVIEKPFGHDLDSAQELNHQVNAVFMRTRCSASITISAKRRCRTFWFSVLRTESSSPSGTATTSIMCRSRLRRQWGSRAAGRFMRRPARCAMWCRTT